MCKPGWELVRGEIQDVKTHADQSSDQLFPQRLLRGVGVWWSVSSGGAEAGQRLLAGSA